MMELQERSIMFVKPVVTKLNLCGYELRKLRNLYNAKKRNYTEQWALMVHLNIL